MKTAAFILGCVGVALGCNGGPATDPDCQNHDMGSCGTACCRLKFTFPVGTDAVALKDDLEKTLSNGGPDGRYAWQTTAGGTFGFSVDFMKTYGIYPYRFLGQAYHTTPFPDGTLVKSGPYRDTINFLIYEDAQLANRTTLRAFANSDINGALGDNGMTYKEIMLAVRNLSTTGWQMSHMDESCPDPKKN
eukprot:TRINITY_DN33509_c0_g1_i1.p1 TRINITY_DN33509_c0_g1~~TRINITY_DN33509_c0_g1_i1.p1  ORF type:complete len:190 (+),score=29.07 TRINITY_DN33509_c0_g1_i1:64-633(+)